jgi:hypothetical protein
MKADVGFSLGFFCGALLGAVGVYLTVSPEGKQLKNRLATEFNEHQRNLILASVMPDDKKTNVEIPEVALKIRSWIKKIRMVTDKTISKPTPKMQAPAVKRKHHFKQK